MPNLLDNLKELLQRDERLVNEGELLKNKVIELAIKLDKDLLELLLSDEKIRGVFFVNVGKTTVFDKDKFIKFISNKQFLPDSYTAFKNKIGLTSGDTFVSKSEEVVLSWPYKDCVLEGGMTKEDQKRNEIFYNETLAPDEISRLLDPKVFTNAKRIDKIGEHNLDGFRRDEHGTIKDNLIIKGNNLLALHSLKKRFAGKIKLIYIDPPYNTGNDGFKYNDSFNHSSWLVFMRNRLEIAKTLLRDDGVIFVQCDDNEQAYLKVLMDEVMERDNFLNCIAVKMSTSAGLKMSHKTKKLLKIKEYILAYTKKSVSFELSDINELYVDKDKYETERSDKYIVNYEDDYSRWKLISLHQAYKKNAQNGQEKIDFVNVNCHRIFNHVINPSTRKAWGKLSEQEKLRYKDKVRKYNVEGSDYQYAFNDHVLIPYNPKNFEGDLWTQNYSIGGTKTDEGDVEFKNGKKREILLKRIISLTTNVGDIVLDYHLGSGTTCAVAHKMRRQYIGIEQLDYGENDSVVRLKNVINGDQSGISKAVSWEGGGDFVYMELAKWNENFVEKINKAKSINELAKIWEEMKKTAFLSYKVDPKTIDKNAKDFAELLLADQKRFLLECLDKNQMYINFSEIDDEDYKVSNEDKELNKEFYKS